jgi:hypothetical protein
VHDGSLVVDGKEYKVELKSTSEERARFSTSSRMGFMKVQAWKKGFDFSVFSTFNKNGDFVEHYMCFQEDLEPFYNRVVDKQNQGHAGRAGMDSWNRAREQLQKLDWDEEELDSLTKQNLFGSRINDPGISLSDVKKWGIKLDNNDPNKHIKQLLKENTDD